MDNCSDAAGDYITLYDHLSRLSDCLWDSWRDKQWGKACGCNAEVLLNELDHGVYLGIEDAHKRNVKQTLRRVESQVGNFEEMHTQVEDTRMYLLSNMFEGMIKCVSQNERENIKDWERNSGRSLVENEDDTSLYPSGGMLR